MAAALEVTTFSDDDVRACRAALPDDRLGTYDMILADPPWRYERGNNIDVPYPTLGPEELKALPVKQMAAPNSVCCLWTTSPKMPEALEILRAWGFEYKTVLFTWLKTNQSSEPAYIPGFYSMSCTEYVLIGVRGSMQSAKRVFNCKQLVQAARGAHSEKPPCVRDQITSLFDCKHRIELFSRHIVPGWSAWGLDVPGWFYDADEIAVITHGAVVRAFLEDRAAGGGAGENGSLDRPVRLHLSVRPATTRGAATDSFTAKNPVIARKKRSPPPKKEAKEHEAPAAAADAGADDRVPVSRGDVVVRGPAKPSRANFATWWNSVNRSNGRPNREVYHVHSDFLSCNPDIRAIVEGSA